MLAGTGRQYVDCRPHGSAAMAKRSQRPGKVGFAGISAIAKMGVLG